MIYELNLLETVYNVSDSGICAFAGDGLIYTKSKERPYKIGYATASLVIGDWKPGFKKNCSPMIFLMAFKILDMLIEWTLHQNQVKPNYRFAQKIKQLDDTITFPKMIENCPYKRTVLINLYKFLEPYRGTIIHDKLFHCDQDTLVIQHSRQNSPNISLEVDADLLTSLVQFLVGIVNCIVGKWHLNNMQKLWFNHIADKLSLLHQTPVSGQKEPFRTCVRIYEDDKNQINIDVKEIRSELSHQNPNRECFFDIRIILMNNSKAIEAYLIDMGFINGKSSFVFDKKAMSAFRVDLPTDIREEDIKYWVE
jgi:hypothetical protein